MLAAGGGICALLIGLNVQLMFSNTRQLHEHSAWVAHTHAVIGGIQSILSLMKDAETGQRGYLITGDPRYLEPYDASIVAINEKVGEVAKLTADNPSQQARFPELKDRIAKRLALLAGNIEARRDRGLEAARQNVLSGLGKAEMDALRALTAEMTRDEERLLEERSGEAQRSYRWALATGVLAGVAALVVVIALVVVLQRHYVARSRAAAVIYNQRELLRVTLASIGDAIVTTDVHGRVTYLNVIAEALTGWKQADAAGIPLERVFNIVNEDTRRVVENPAMRALREGIIVGLANHTVLIARDGSERPIDDSASPIRDESGEIVGCVLVFRDVTERRDAERQIRVRVEQLAEGDRRKDEFLATLAHELRNPLAPLSNAMAILKRAGNDAAVLARTREMMERQLHQMVRLIDDLLDVSRISRGKLDLRVERVELGSVIRQAVETCKPMAEAARHEVTLALPEQPIELEADPVRLAQVFSNLVSNACKFTPPGGHVRIAAALQGDEVSVTVSDDGIGIPQDKLDEVFDMFAQIDHSLERSHGGLGIGLTLVRKLVGMHGGSVVAHSDGPGQGSLFSVRLPLG